MQISVSKPFPCTINLLDYCDRKTSKVVRQLTLNDGGKPRFADEKENKKRVKQGLPELPTMPFSTLEKLSEAIVVGLTIKITKEEGGLYDGEIIDFYNQMDDAEFQKVAELTGKIFSNSQELPNKKKQ